MIGVLIDASLVLVLMLLLSASALVSPLPSRLRLLLCAGLGLRVLGAVARYMSAVYVYGGLADAFVYYERGLEYAQLFWREPFSSLAHAVSQDLMVQWWGTPFVRVVSGLLLIVTGPTILGQSILFSLLAFVGLCGFVVAFHRTHPATPLDQYCRWIWLIPSLWFWPSTVGKEAPILAGIGLAVMGFVPRRGGWRNWPLLALGTALVYAVRPQVAAVLVFALLVGEWLSAIGRGFTPSRMAQAALLAVVGVLVIRAGLSQAGAGGLDLDDIQNYIESSKGRRAGGGSRIEAVEFGAAGAGMGMVTVLFRPLLVEASNPMMAVSGLEVTVFWVIAWRRRRRIAAALRNWRSDPLVQVAVPFILLYATTLGMTISNLGVIARQRIFLFPFLFVLLESVPVRKASPRRVGASGRTPPSPPLGHEIPVPVA
jgi:hypothetical protein